MTERQLSRLKFLLFLGSLLPLAYLVWGVADDAAGANPIEALCRKTGTWSFNFLLITLCVTPLRKLSGWHWLIRVRRELGLFTFFYACLHFATYLSLDQLFDFASIAHDIVKRPSIAVGFAAFVLLIPLAATSNNRAVQRLGGARWQQLHYTVYAVAIITCVHYFWLVEPIALIYPLIYALLVAILLGYRARERIRRYGPYPPNASANTAANAPANATGGPQAGCAPPVAQPIRFVRSRPKRK